MISCPVELVFAGRHVGFMTSVLELHCICMGFKGCHLKTHANSIEVVVAMLKTNANSRNFLLICLFDDLSNTSCGF